jgi:hypothetical protein
MARDYSNEQQGQFATDIEAASDLSGVRFSAQTRTDLPFSTPTIAPIHPKILGSLTAKQRYRT